jgi:hypothetical protein
MVDVPPWRVWRPDPLPKDRGRIVLSTESAAFYIKLTNFIDFRSDVTLALFTEPF